MKVLPWEVRRRDQALHEARRGQAVWLLGKRRRRGQAGVNGLPLGRRQTAVGRGGGAPSPHVLREYPHRADIWALAPSRNVGGAAMG